MSAEMSDQEKKTVGEAAVILARIMDVQSTDVLTFCIEPAEGKVVVFQVLTGASAANALEAATATALH